MSINYIGYDVSTTIVDHTNSKYGSDNVSFRLSKVNQTYEAADLVVCKDVLQHLPFADIWHILNQRNKFKISVFVNDVDENVKNVDIRAGSYRSLDITKPPFNVKCDRIEYLHDSQAPVGGRKTTCVIFNFETTTDEEDDTTNTEGQSTTTSRRSETNKKKVSLEDSTSSNS